MHQSSHPTLAATAMLLVLALLVLGCGGGSGGPGPDGAGQGLVLMNFAQSGLDNLPLNEVLRFTFSEALDPTSVSVVSIQIRSGPNFGRSVDGVLSVDGKVVTFQPRLPGRCDFQDAGFQPDTDYSIALLGIPEEFALRNSVGQPLEATSIHQFHTLNEEDDALFRDNTPNMGPSTLSVTPSAGTAEVPVLQGNKIVVEFSENIDPCSIDDTTVLFHMFEIGDRDEGFIPVEDNSEDPLTWGSTNDVTRVEPPQGIPSSIALEQDYDTTQLTITPIFGEFPDNALLVLRLTFGIRDFSGRSLTPVTISFTTQNREAQTSGSTLEYDDTTPISESGTTADVNTERAPSLAQGYLLFSGDGDNGEDPYSPSLPNSVASECTLPLQANNGQKDDFFPSGDVWLDTGGTLNTCPNTVDGSTAVVWEFKTFGIPSGVTVRIIGVNPAIILVQNEVLIASGGRLLARGDGSSPSPQGAGGGASASSTTATKGGLGVAGGGDGGSSFTYPAPSTGRYGNDGVQGYFTKPSGAIDDEVGEAPGLGGGEGNTSGRWNTQTTCNRNLPSAGGGGHAAEGDSGTSLGTGSSPVSLDLPIKGLGGGVYGATDQRMRRAEAGSGGGAGGELRSFASTAARGPGGSGGAGGGFIDITCSGDISVFGTIDAAGSRGGKGSGNPFSPNYTYNPGTGAGGGGSGGGIRLISAGDIIFGSSTVLTAAGGAGGVGGTNQGTPAPVNPGGIGGLGRIVLEDSDSVITGFENASVTPGEGADGFFRGPFDPTRFSGGGLNTEALTLPILSGPLPVPGVSPVYADPVTSDFVAGIPRAGSRGQGTTGILVEARGWKMTTEGDLDGEAGPTEWTTVGTFADSGIPKLPTWKLAADEGIPGDIDLAPDNPGISKDIRDLVGYPYLQVRLTFYMPSTATPLTEGPYVDRLTLRFTYDQ